MGFDNPTIRFGLLTCRSPKDLYRVITQWKRFRNLNLKRNFRDDHVRPIGIGFEELIGPELSFGRLDPVGHPFKPNRDFSFKPRFPDEMDFEDSRASPWHGKILGTGEQLKAGNFFLDLESIDVILTAAIQAVFEDQLEIAILFGGVEEAAVRVAEQASLTRHDVIVPGELLAGPSLSSSTVSR